MENRYLLREIDLFGRWSQALFPKEKVMEIKNTVTRNTIGAFLGGFAGILAFGFIHPLALPFGCFLGVVIGWWHRELWRSTVKGIRRGVSKLRKIKHLLIFRSHSIDNASLKGQFASAIKPIQSRIVRLTSSLSKTGSQFIYDMKDPETRISLIQICSAAVFIFPALIAVKMTMERSAIVYRNEFPADFFNLTVFTYYILSCIAIVVVTAAALGMEERREESYFVIGPTRFFLKTVVRMYTLYVGAQMMLFGNILWFVAALCTLLSAVVIPISATVWFLRGFRHVITKAGHQLCFGATLATTAVIAWMMKNHFGDPRILWSVALASGFVSAIVTELTRKVAEKFFAERPRLQMWIDKSIAARLNSSGQWFIGTTERSNKAFFDVVMSNVTT